MRLSPKSVYVITLAIEDHQTLSNHLNRLSKCTPCLAVNTVSVRRGDHIWTRLVDFRMDHKSCLVDRQLGSALSDVSLVVNQDKVGGFDSREVLGKRVHPEVVLEDRICTYQYWSIES